MNFNFDYGRIDLGTTHAQPANLDAPLYAAVGGRAASLSNNECVFQPDRGGDLEVMTHQVLQAMDQTREFRSLDEHVARVASVIPGLNGQTEAIRRVLGYLVDRRLLLSDADFLAGLQQSGSVAGTSLRSLVVRACDRPVQVQRLLHSLQLQAQEFGRSDGLTLIDDSRNDVAAEEHRRLLTAHASALGVPVVYVGSAQARAVADRLAQAVPAARELLPSLLHLGQGAGFGGGRGYNLALLLTAGGQLALLDDDYVVDFRTSAHSSSGLAIDPQSPWATRFPEDAEATLAYGERLTEDAFSMQTGMVGRTLGQVFADHPDLLPTREQLRGMSLARLAHLRPDARIVSTFTGVRGASFTSDNAWLYQLDDRSRADFWRSRESYLRHVNAETLVSAFEKVVARPHGTFTPFVTDNSRLMPCSSPLGRGEDALFSVAANYLYPTSLTLHLPITIGHQQEGRRPRQERGLQAITPGINRFLWEWIRNQAQPARSADAGNRLAFLVAQLEDLANAPEAERISVLSEYLRYVRADAVERIQQQIVAAPDAPVYWVADARAIVEANGKALLANTAPRLDDWPLDIDATGCAQRLREACLGLAAAWRHWPALWHAAADMGARLLPSR